MGNVKKDENANTRSYTLTLTLLPNQMLIMPLEYYYGLIQTEQVAGLVKTEDRVIRYATLV